MSKTELFLIKTKCGNFKSFKELQEYADSQYETLEKVLSDNKKLQEEITHLKNVLIQTTQMLEDKEFAVIIKTPAEVACDIQIEKIQDLALQRDLSLEEAKKLDIFIKNQRLFQADRKVVEGRMRKIRNDNISDAQLIEIAAKSINRDDSESGS